MAIERRVVRISQNGAAGSATDVGALPFASYACAGKETVSLLFFFREIIH